MFDLSIEQFSSECVLVLLVIYSCVILSAYFPLRNYGGEDKLFMKFYCMATLNLSWLFSHSIRKTCYLYMPVYFVENIFSEFFFFVCLEHLGNLVNSKYFTYTWKN